MPDSADSISVEFRLSWEDWLDARHIGETDPKTLKLYRADYLRFNAEQRSFCADEHGWTYSSASGVASHDWGDLIGVGQLNRVILLIATCFYPLPRSAFDEHQLACLQHWLDLAMS